MSQKVVVAIEASDIENISWKKSVQSKLSFHFLPITTQQKFNKLQNFH